MANKQTESAYQLSNVLRVLKKYKWTLFAVFVVLGFTALLFTFLNNDNHAMALLSMNYSGIERGENPNGTRFSINMLVSDEVLSDALQDAGLADRLSADDLRQYLSIGSETASASTEGYYYSSSYSLSFQGDREWRRLGVSAEDMLNLILKNYQRRFNEKYTVNYSLLEKELLLADEDDYNSLCTQYKIRAKQMGSYLDMRTNTGAQAYRSSDQLTFASLKKRVNNLIDYTLADFEAYIWEKGVADANTKLVQTLLYRNSELDETRKLNFITYEVRKRIITEYDSAMSAVVLIPSEDSMEQYYMSRTRIGIDYLAEQAYDGLGKAEQIAKTIQYNDDRIAKIQNARVQSNIMQTIIALAKASAAELEGLQQDIILLDKEYVQDREKNYFSFRVKTFRLRDKLEPDVALLAAIAGVTVAFACLYCVESRRRTREGIAHAKY